MEPLNVPFTESPLDPWRGAGRVEPSKKATDQPPEKKKPGRKRRKGGVQIIYEPVVLTFH
jgi:hypothetical protein